MINIGDYLMQVSTNYNQYNIYTPQFKAKPVSQAFSQKVVKPLKTKRVLPKLLAVLLPLSILKCTSNVDVRTSGVTDTENYKIEYFDVNQSTRDVVDNSLKDFKEQATNTDFLDGMVIDITKKYENLDDKDSFRRHLKNQKNVECVHGTSFYSDSAIPNRICLQEAAHNDDKFLNFIRNFEFSSLESIDFTLMHELGHQFDKFYGHDHNANFAVERDNMLSKSANQDSLSVYNMPKDKNDLKIEYEYIDNSGLSDKTKFKEAFLKDLQNIAEIKKQDNGKLAYNIDYFIAGINFDKEITEKLVYIHDGSRAEVYANLFSYAVGKDDGDKEVFTQNFKNCYEVVKQDVLEKIGIQ